MLKRTRPYAWLLRQFLADVRRRVPSAPRTPSPFDWDKRRITAAWLGQATVLINFYGLRILTDPVLFDHVGLSFGFGRLGPKRYVKCALAPDQLPEVDVVLISHAHWDHLDFPSLRRLKGVPQIITAAHTSDLYAGMERPAPRELCWGESTDLNGEARIEAFPVEHWGRRWPRARERGYNGYLIERKGDRLLFAGDTAFTHSFASLQPRGPFLAAFMPIAGYNPWIQSHCTPEEATQMARVAGAQRIAPIHHATFKLSDEAMTEPLERLETSLAATPEYLAWRQIGETALLA